MRVKHLLACVLWLLPSCSFSNKVENRHNLVEVVDKQPARRAARSLVLVYDMFNGTFGSGFAVDDDSIATAAHVCRSVICAMADVDNNAFVGTLEYVDKKHDLALLHVKDGHGVKPAKLARMVVLGQNVWTIANPGLLRGTVARGIVGGFRGKDGWVVQTDAMVDRGSSGGMLVNRWGRVVGTIYAMSKSGGVGFASHVRYVKRALDATSN